MDLSLKPRGGFPLKWTFRARELDFATRTAVMGVVNVTPDSFSDGGRFFGTDPALAEAVRMSAEGADIVDVGGESTRPGGEPVSAQEEMDRVIPVIERIRSETDLVISIDTYKAEVAREAIKAGAEIVNDVSAGRFDPAIFDVIVENPGVRLILMHMRGEPRTMQKDIHYADVVQEVRDHLEDRVRAAEAKGIARERLAVDPGIGFGKLLSHNLRLIRELEVLHGLGCPVVLGVSRKAFIGRLLDLPVDQRLEGTLAAATAGVLYGADMVRVHDVREARRVVTIADALAGKSRQED